MDSPIRARLLLIAVSVLVAAPGCSRAPVLTVRNDSSQTLSNVVVSGTGFSERISMLPSGVEHRLRVKPQGESGVRLTFDAGGQQVDSGIQGYIEPAGGYRVRVTVGTNLNVSIEAPQ